MTQDADTPLIVSATPPESVEATAQTLVALLPQAVRDGTRGIGETLTPEDFAHSDTLDPGRIAPILDDLSTAETGALDVTAATRDALRPMGGDVGQTDRDDAPTTSPLDAEVDTQLTWGLPRLPISCPEALRDEAARLAQIDSEPSHDRDALRLVDKLGAGGMGVVYRAHQPSLGRDVAVKTLKEGSSKRLRNVRVLLDEARLTGQLEHPNIIPVHALGQADASTPLLVMKRIDGVPWSALIDDEAHPTWDKLLPSPDADRLTQHLRILLKVCDAVAFAHARGVIHRDLKPDNVMVGDFGEVYVLDWGIALRLGDDVLSAEMQRFGQIAVVGTLAYMAPEMVKSDLDAIGPHTDVYLLGGILYTLFHKRAPHTGGDLNALMLRICQGDLPPLKPDLPAPWRDIITRALAAAPADRYPTARAFQRAVQAIVEHRASLQLALDTQKDLARLRDLLTAPPDASPAEATAARDTRRDAIGEAFQAAFMGFALALRQWPDNALARDGLRDALTHMIRAELDDNNATAAKRLALHLTPPDPNLTERIRAKLAEQHEAETRRRALERDLDASVNATARERLTLGFFVVPVCVTAFILHQAWTGAEVTHGELTAFVGVALGIYLVLVARRWRELTSTLINRRLIASLGLLIAAVFLNRIAGWYLNHPIDAIHVHDLCIFVGMVSVMAATLSRRFIPGAVASLVGLIITVALPYPAHITFSGALCLIIVAMIWGLIRMRRDAALAAAVRDDAPIEAP